MPSYPTAARRRLRRTAEHVLGARAPNRRAPRPTPAAGSSSSAEGGEAAHYAAALHILSDEMALAGTAAEINPRWIGSTPRFTYLNRRPGAKQFILVDASSTPPTRGPAFDHEALAAALTQASGEQVEPEALPFNAITLSDDDLQFTTSGRSYTCDLTTMTLTSTEVEDSGPALPRTDVPSPAGSLTAFVQGGNLWLRDTETGETMQLSHDGEQGYEYATPLLGEGLLGSEIAQGSKGRFTPGKMLITFSICVLPSR